MTAHSDFSLIEPLYVDDTLLVVDKPSGLLAVPGRGADKQDCLSARVQARYPDALIVHRLDMACAQAAIYFIAIHSFACALESRAGHVGSSNFPEY